MQASGSVSRKWTFESATPGRGARRLLAAAAFAVLTAVGAQVAVPLPWTPVPMTLQPLFVVLAGALLGPGLGAAAMVAYVLAGAVGLPVFSGGHAGILWLLGPTGGYLLACPVAAWVVGRIAGERDSGVVRLLAALVSGMLVLYAGGVAQLALLTGGGLGEPIALGVAPFVGGDLVKVLIALALAGPVRPRSLGWL